MVGSRAMNLQWPNVFKKLAVDSMAPYSIVHQGIERDSQQDVVCDIIWTNLWSFCEPIFNEQHLLLARSNFSDATSDLQAIWRSDPP